MISLRFFKFYLRKKQLISFALVTILIVNVVMLGSYFNLKGVLSRSFFAKDEKGLRGGHYMKEYDRREYEIIGWINKNIMGTPTVLERYSKSFDTRAARISMHTGLPTYLGWDGHVYLRGAPWREIEQRKKEIDYIFNDLDPIAVLNILSKREINFIVIGELERKFYSAEGLEKFAQNSEMFKLLFKSGKSALYGVGNYKNYLSHISGVDDTL